MTTAQPTYRLAKPLAPEEALGLLLEDIPQSILELGGKSLLHWHCRSRMLKVKEFFKGTGITGASIKGAKVSEHFVCLLCGERKRISSDDGCSDPGIL